MKPEVLGIDLGGVVIGKGARNKVNADEDTSFFGKNYLRTPAIPGAFESIRRLVERFGPANIFIVSKASEPTEIRSLKWLEHHNFFEYTGLPRENVYFCREREGKAPIALALGLTHMVDDRLEVLGYMSSVQHRFLFRPQQDEVNQHLVHRADVTRVESWDEIVALIFGETLPHQLLRRGIVTMIGFNRQEQWYGFVRSDGKDFYFNGMLGYFLVEGDEGLRFPLALSELPEEPPRLKDNSRPRVGDEIAFVRDRHFAGKSPAAFMWCPASELDRVLVS